jgi:hypothetical protein
MRSRHSRDRKEREGDDSVSGQGGSGREIFAKQVEAVMGMGHQGRLAEYSERDKEIEIEHLCCVSSSVSTHHLLAACDLQQGTLI